MSHEKILFVDDTADVRATMQIVLEREGYHVCPAVDGEDALRQLFAFRPDLVLLDIMLPGMDGIAACERINAVSNVPIIMLTALGEEAEKVRALKCGADDYVVKGTGMDELLARVEATLRRAELPAVEPVPEHHADPATEIDFNRREVKVRGVPVDLTPTEYGLLASLVRRRGTPATTRELLATVWDGSFDPDLVKWHIARLRRKIELDPNNPELVVTRRGFGYAYRAPAG